jgi:hypothetical protein
LILGSFWVSLLAIKMEYAVPHSLTMGS